MCDGPVKADDLIFRHGGATFREGGNGEGVWEGEGGSRRRFEEYLVGYAGMFVFVTTTLADVL